MLLERFYDEDLAQASYLVGCQASGEAVMIDPRRDVQIYLDTAARHDMRIVAVTETHIHADYLSGTREVARATGAQIYLSGEGGPDWRYGFEGTLLHHGDAITVGNVRIEALHTPGHTPEHLVFLVTDGGFADEPGYLFSGDFTFAGDLGRPDLLDEAAGGADTRFAAAQDMYNSLRNVFLTLADHVQVFPAHGAGSACGKSLGALPSTTVGYERRNAWWGPLLGADDRDGFVSQLLDGQPDAHSYFSRMKRQNRDGPQLLGDLEPLLQIASQTALRRVGEQEVIFVDTRQPDLVRAGTVAGALAIPGTGKTASYGAWAYDPEIETRPLLLLTVDRAEAEQVRNHLIRVGIDRYAGFVTDLTGFDLVQSSVVQPDDLDRIENAFLLDIRGRSEHDSGHIPGSTNISAGRLLWRMDELPRDRPIVSYCETGVRNIVTTQALRREGLEVIELEGSYAAWAAADRRQMVHG